MSDDQRGAETGVQGSYLKVVHIFTDVSGERHNVLQVGSEYMIEGNTHERYSPTIEDAVRAENIRVINRYRGKYNHISINIQTPK